MLAVVGLVLVQALSPALALLDRDPRSRWLAFAGRVAVTLFSLQILPEFAASQQVLSEPLAGVPAFLDRHIYLLTLIALIPSTAPSER